MVSTVNKSLTITFLAVFIIISSFNVDLVGAQNTAAGTAASQPLSDQRLSRYLRFIRLSAENVLSGDHTRNVVQDQRGLMWIGTLNGLNRFDGTSVKLYRNDPDNPNSLSNNVARALVVDQSGVLWIGTWGGGLNQYDWETDTFIRYQHDPDDPRSLSHNIVRAVYEDHSGTIWVGTMAGLNRLDRDSGQFIRYQHNPDDPNSLSDNVIWSIFEDSAGVRWVGTENGLNRFDPDTETFVSYRHDPADPTSLSHNSVRAVFEDRSGNLWLGTGGGLDKLSSDRTRITSYQHDENDPQSLSHNVIHWVHEDRSGRLWIGTWGGGLNLFDRGSETFTHYRHNSADPYSLNSDSIWQIYEGQQDMLWIATEGGVSYFDGRAKPFHHYRAIPGTPNSLSDSHVNSLHAGQDGVVWVATNSGGLNKFDRQTESFTQYLNSASGPIDISNDNLTAIYEDQLGLIWIGTRGTGLIKYDPYTEQVENYRHDDTNPHSLSYDSVVNIYEDRSGTLWIGTYGGGLNGFDRDTERFTRYQHDPSDPHSLSANVIISVYEDRDGVLWVGTISDGLNKLDREAGEFIRYRHDASDPHSLTGDAIASIFEQKTGEFWISTVKGLDKFDRQKGQVVRSYSMKDGLPDDTVCGILEDEYGVLWLGTQNGLSRFDPQTESFRSYTISDGLQGKSFALYTSPSKSPSGEMFFPGSGGFNAFYPDQIVDNLNPPPILITSFQLANQPVPIGGDSVLKKSILETDELVLSYQDNVFSFEFVALDYRDPEKNRYKYKMEGFEEEWNEVDSTRRFGTYTNLDPGNYVFRVSASNNDGVWNEDGASIKITITPPWWETMWFRIGMVVVAIALLAFGFRWRVSAIEARSRKLEIQVEDRTKELQKAKEEAETANKAKSTFLANMSHELRTPLHAILGFSRLMTRDSDLNEVQKGRLDIINRSGEHLLSMIDDVLSLTKIEAGRVELKQEQFDVTQLLQDVGQMMKSRTGGKGLRFNSALDPALHPHVQGDAGKLRQILINLLGNAVKFTETGDVSLRARSQPMANDPERVMLQFEVQDTGPGIPQDRLDEIFESFVRLDYAQKVEGGTGLGLAISKTLVDMMNGKITVASKPGQGTLFKVKIPLQIVEGEQAIPDKVSVAEVIGLQADQPDLRIMVVDDNTENRVLLTTLLTNIGCNVKEAKNGEEAIAIFQEWRPHFIWMDMRMPVMDGFSATRKIRTLPSGEAVKIVAVTASVLEERYNEILACGCDEVVRKPFRDHEIFEAMARQLGLKYIYEDKVAETLPRQGIDLTAEIMAKLAPDLLQELREKSLSLDRQAISDVIDRIEALAPDTAKGLRTLLDDFQIGRIRDLLGEVK